MDFNGVGRTTLSEVKDDLVPVESDLSDTVKDKVHLDGKKRRGAE